MNWVFNSKSMKIKKRIGCLFFCGFVTNISAQAIIAGDSVVGGDKEYFINEDKNVVLIYPKEHLQIAQYTQSKELVLHKKYQKLYGWKLDEKLYVGLISSKNQIANGFSTQYPYNRQINYVGGTLYIDEFASASWLDTLLYHETAHNYQANIKGSKISQFLHTIFKNGTFLFDGSMIIPNIMENPFLLEGNAVLMESIHGNGGRLYNGSYKAETILQAKAGKLKASQLYNKKLAFPFGDIAYIQGGFYQLYMAQKYGIQNLNHYFYFHSQDFFWPQFTNKSMFKAVGIDFEDSIKAFENYYKTLAKIFVKAKGKKLFSSKFYYPLNKQNENIMFITQSIASAPTLNNINIKNKKIDKHTTTLIPSKVLKIKNNYYTQATKFVDSEIVQGLFDEKAMLLSQTKSKMVQGYLKNGSLVYFDVKTSFLSPNLYIDNKFYAKVNSSVFIDKKDNLFFFKQKNKTRILYKNKKPLYSFEGYYGKVVDVDSKGGVYFIANSKLGSSLYRYFNGDVLRVSSADNIKDAKLIDDNYVFLSCIGEDNYYYVINRLEKKYMKPYATKLFFEYKNYFDKKDNVLMQKNNISLEHSYNSFLNMHYSGLDLFAGYTSLYGINGSFSLKFSDPLVQNTFSFYGSKDSVNTKLLGIEYDNFLSIFHFNINTYKVLSDQNNKYGLMLHTDVPLYRKGYYEISSSIDYFKDYRVTQREPITFTTSLKKQYNYPASLLPDLLHKIDFMGERERDYFIFGMEYSYIKNLSNLFYFGSTFNGAWTSTNSTQKSAKGIKLSSYKVSYDPTTVVIPNISYDGYAKSAFSGEVKLAKVFYLSSYFFTFPLSLQNEILYAKYKYYSLKDFKKDTYNVKEFQVGLTVSSIYLNSFVVPMELKYVYDNASFIQNKHSISLSLGIDF